jgi:uncharacterized membrane protein
LQNKVVRKKVAQKIVICTIPMYVNSYKGTKYNIVGFFKNLDVIALYSALQYPAKHTFDK